MASSNGFTDNVEDMSNAELFQYLFKAELDTDLTAALPETLFQDVDAATSPSPSFSSSSSSLSSPPASSSSASSYENSPVNTSLSYSSSSSPLSPYLQLDMESHEQQEQEHSQQQQAQPFTFLPLQPAAPTLLPSSSFSYRQLTPNMPPSMPVSSTPLPASGSTDNQFLNLVQTATASSAPKMTSDQVAFWMQRIQQLQQIEQHQHQLAPSLFSQPSSNSSESTSSASGKNVIYPSPPMKDDMSLDSDDEEGPSHDGDSASDPLKPSPSELKKMTSKERRQLRNKLSARNFRVRRKEYIGSLENQVKEARKEAAELQKKLAQSELNCQFLRQELETVRLSQTLFNDGRMSREHANLLASLLNPNTESFPLTSPTNAALSVSQHQQQQQRELMESINHNNMTILNNSLTVPQPVSNPEASLQAFVPFDGNWELIINRAETFMDPILDPKDVKSKEAVYSDLLARYEAAKQEAEVDEQMRTELKAYHEQKLAETYVVMPKEDAVATMSNKAGQDALMLQTMVYMMMIHLTRSLFEAATLSKSQLVNVVQTMDQPLRSKMGQEQQQRNPCKFAEWREAWIKKCWPSYYNNRRRVCELLSMGLCPSSTLSSGVDVDETVRKMEEGVKDKTVVPPVTPLCVRLRDCISSLLRCPDQVAREERDALMRQSKASSETTV